MMSPRVRLPLVELANESKAEIDAVLAQVAEGYADYLIGSTAAHGQRFRSFGRPRRKHNFAGMS